MLSARLANNGRSTKSVPLSALTAISSHPENEARHALAIGIQSPDDELKHRLLENFERNRLEGAVTDFGQLILLFTAAAQSNYRFVVGKERLLHAMPMIALEYKQISGAAGLTVFHERAMDVRTTEGEIWLRDSDLVPLRITMFTEKPLGNQPDNPGPKPSSTTRRRPTASHPRTSTTCSSSAPTLDTIFSLRTICNTPDISGSRPESP